MGADFKNLIQQRRGWYAVVEVPRPLRAKLGRRIKRTLRTADIHVARARRHAVVAAILKNFDAVRREIGEDPILEEALAYRETFDALSRGKRVVEVHGGGDDAPTPKDLVASWVSERAQELHEEGRTADAGTLYGVAMGTATPVEAHVERWLSEGGSRGPVKPRTAAEYRTEVKRLVSWMRHEGFAPTVQTVTRKIAGLYVSAGLGGAEADPKTVRKKISALASYWDWLRRRGHADDEGRSPWERQAPAKPAVRSLGDFEDGKERPFTHEEVQLLLRGPAGQPLADFLRVALLSGMRREEIARLLVADCGEETFRVRQGKTGNARRMVPIHPDLHDIVTARCVAKEGSRYLFDDLGGASEGRRSDPLGKRFTRYRRAVGVQDGKGRRSLVNFHSCRRWFTTAALRAGQPERVVRQVIGHKLEGVTLTAYFSGCVSAWKKDPV